MGNMANPNGAIQTIGSAETTAMAIGVAFLEYWAFGAQSGGWASKHLFVLILGGLSYFPLAYVPFDVTRSEKRKKRYP